MSSVQLVCRHTASPTSTTSCIDRRLSRWTATTSRTLERLGVRRILNLVEDREYEPGERAEVELALAPPESRRRASSSPTTDTSRPSARGGRHRGQRLAAGRRARYVHCRAGWQRSAAVAAGVVAVTDGIEIEDALDQVRRRKPSANPLPHQREELLDWWHERAAGPVSPDLS